MNRIFAFASLALAGSLAACSPYSPDLGNVPFRCGSNMECPDGYDCQMVSASNVCVAKGGSPIDSGGSGSGASFDCTKDSVLEGASHNNTIQTASSTPVGCCAQGQRSMITYSNLAICPDGDTDLYRVDIDTANKNIKATVTYDAASIMGGAPLDVAILNNSGATSVNGQPNGENTVTASLPNAATASAPYYVRVQGPATGENYYSLTIEVN